MKENCEVIQDLLPNYIEKLTSEKTNEYIENHIKECTECAEMLKNMRSEIKSEPKNANKKEINYLKKYNRRLKGLAVIILLIAVIYVVIIGNKMLILNKITSKAQESMQNNNYYIRAVSFSGTTMRIDETYKKGEKQITKVKIYESEYAEQSVEYIYYINGNKVTYYIQNNNAKIEKVGEGIRNEDGAQNLPLQEAKTLYTYNENIWLFLKNAIMSSVSTVKCNGKECYYFLNLENTGMVKSEMSTEIYFDKETGLPIRVIGGTEENSDGIWDSVIDFKYEFNTVTDSDVEEPVVNM